MKEIIERILPLWGLEARQLSQIYSSAWEVDHSCVMKAYRDRDQLERNLRISEILSECHIPVAEVVPATANFDWIETCMSKRRTQKRTPKDFSW